MQESVGSIPISRVPIREKLVIFTAAVLLLAILVSNLLIYTRGRDILEQRILAGMNAVANSRADQVVGLVEQNFERTALVASRTKLRECLVDIQEETGNVTASRAKMVKILNDARASVDSIQSIDIMGVGGRVIASTTPSSIGRNDATAPWFTEGLKHRKLCCFTKRGDSVLVSLALPLVHPADDQDRTIGVVKTDVLLNRLTIMLTDRTGLGETGELLLAIFRHGDITVLNPLRHRPDAVLQPLTELNSDIDLSHIEKAIRGDSGFQHAVDYRGSKTLNVYRHIPVADGWGLIAKMDTAEAFAPISRLQRQALLIGGCLALLGIFGVMAIAAYISAPIRDLQQGTERLGAGNLDYRVSVKSRDEIGQLSASFNEMADNLQRITASRDDLNREVQERERAEEELRGALQKLERSNKDLEQFAYSASHDLQEPLRKVAAFGSLLEKRYAEDFPQQAREFIGYMQSGAQRMQCLIDDLLVYSRVTTRPKPFRKIDLNEVVEEVLEDLELRIEESEAEIGVDKLPEIEADPSQMRQLFQNLIANGLKFRREGTVPRIHVSAGMPDTNVDDDPNAMTRISVSDNGIGFDEAQTERIFQVFQRLHSRQEYRGSGIGLAVCQRIVERHGGQISAESPGDSGAKFTVTLPVNQPKQPPAQEN